MASSEGFFQEGQEGILQQVELTFVTYRRVPQHDKTYIGGRRYTLVNSFQIVREINVNYCAGIEYSEEDGELFEMWYSAKSKGYSTGMVTDALSSALFTLTVRIPSRSLAETLLLSTGRGSQTVRVNVELPENERSVEI